MSCEILDDVWTGSISLGVHADNVGVEHIRTLQLSVGGDGRHLRYGSHVLPVPVVDHPEAVVTVMGGKLKKVATLHSKRWMVEKYVLKQILA